MGIRNAKALGRGRASVAGHSAQRKLQSRINILGLPGTHVPAGRVRIPTGVHLVKDYYLMNPATKGLVREWVNHDRATPLVQFAMETKGSPHNPGMLHPMKRGADAGHMDLIPEDEIITDYDLDAEQHLELVGEPIDVLSWPAQVVGNSGDVMSGLNFFEQTALAAFLNRVTIQERAAAHLGALSMVSEVQIVHAGTNHSSSFEGSQWLPGMPSTFFTHLTRDLYDSRQLSELPAKQRVNAGRVWRGDNRYIDGALPVFSRYYCSDVNLYDHCTDNVARFAVLPLPR